MKTEILIATIIVGLCFGALNAVTYLFVQHESAIYACSAFFMVNTLIFLAVLVAKVAILDEVDHDDAS